MVNPNRPMVRQIVLSAAAVGSASRSSANVASGRAITSAAKRSSCCADNVRRRNVVCLLGIRKSGEPVGLSIARCGGRHAGHYQRSGCANCSTRQVPFGIRTEVERPKFFSALKLWTGEPLSAIYRMARTAFEILANTCQSVVCRAK
jgi:hypothetical protein